MNDHRRNEKRRDVKVEDICHFSDGVSVYRERPLTEHAHVFKGSFVSDPNTNERTPCAVKFPRDATQFTREISALKKLGPYDHVISLLHYGYHSDGFINPPYIALERCHDLNLHELVTQRREAIPIYDVAWGFKFCKQIIDGVSFIHNALIVHKDLKPSNILLTLDLKRIKIADFGSCQWISSFASAMFCSDMFGTTGYRPPESYGNSYVSLKSDIFSLGAVFYFILSNGKSPFGEQPDMWDYNSKYGITNMCDLLVPNKRTAKHLICSMLHLKRTHRPSIRSVYCHPCWSGDDIDFDIGYKIEEVLEGRNESTSAPQKDLDLDNQGLLKALGHIPTTPQRAPIQMEKCIAICNQQNSSLQCFSPKHKTLRHLHEYNDAMKPSLFSTVAVGSDIYVLIYPKLAYRLQCKYENPVWERMQDMIESHGHNPTAVALKGDIYVVGKSGVRLRRNVSQFQPFKNKWNKLPDKNLPTCHSAVVSCGNFIYSIGGSIDQALHVTETVERMDITSGEWKDVAPLTPGRRHATGAAYDGQVLVVGGRIQGCTDLNTVDRYSPQTNQWTTMASMIKKRWGPPFRCHVIEGKVYAVGGDGPNFGKTVEEYNANTGKWSILEISEADIEIWSSAMVDLRQLK